MFGDTPSKGLGPDALSFNQALYKYYNFICSITQCIVHVYFCSVQDDEHRVAVETDAKEQQDEYSKLWGVSCQLQRFLRCGVSTHSCIDCR